MPRLLLPSLLPERQSARGELEASTEAKGFRSKGHELLETDARNDADTSSVLPSNEEFESGGAAVVRERPPVTVVQQGTPLAGQAKVTTE